jgi:hypothetical protein
MSQAQNTAFDPNASPSERNDALGQLQAQYAPKSESGLIMPMGDLAQIAAEVRADMMDMELAKANAQTNIVPFPSRTAVEKKVGMQSVWVDDMQISIMGDYFERPSPLSYDAMRMMVEQTPVLNAVVMTRVRQVQRFCRVQESGRGPGFVIRHQDKEHQLDDEGQKSVNLLQRFFTNCGWEFNARKRRSLKRDNFHAFMGKSVRDSLIMDSAPIETELRRDRDLGIAGLYAVDGATMRLCAELGYKGDDEVFALQVIQGRICTAYTRDDLILEARNPRTDVLLAGYGLSEVELLVKVVTGFLNAMTLNMRGFSDNSIPRGVMHLQGNYTPEDLVAFKRYWNSMVKGINNQWSVPVLVSKDAESKASFENFGVEFSEMYFKSWMTFLTSMICAVYGMSPDEINFETFSAGKSSMSGSDTAEKLADSKDKGLRPLLQYYENLLTDYVVSSFSEDYCFRWTGLDDADEAQRNERAKLTLTVNEMRAEDGRDKMDGELGDAPLNPTLIGPWTQIMQAKQPQDFGTGEEEGAQPGAQEVAQDGGDGSKEPPQNQIGSESQDDQGENRPIENTQTEEPAPSDAAPDAAEPAADKASAGVSAEDDSEDDKPLKKALDFGTPLSCVYVLGE